MRTLNGRRQYIGGWNIANIGDLVILTDGTGKGSLTVFDVVAMRTAPLYGEGPGGTTVIWAVSTPSAPYKLDAKGATGGIPAGGTTSQITPDAYVLQANEVMQARFKPKFIDNTSANSGAHIGMFDVFAYNPGSTSAWGTKNVPGIMNSRTMVGDPADAVALPLVDTNMSAPTAAAALTDGFMSAEKTEMCWNYNQQTPAFVLRWNSASSTPAGIAVALETSAYVYYIQKRASGDRPYTIAGYSVMVPDDVSVDDIIPIQISSPAL
jgi:hypothetical protein